MATRALVFPGQGSQTVGMAAALASTSAAAREALQEADEALGQNLSRLMAQGPIEELTLTTNAQPAIMASSLAVIRVLEREAGVVLADRVMCVAGHSLGEYSALCAAGALDLAQTARLLKVRGQAMQAAVPVGIGAMAAILGAEFADVHALVTEAAQGEVCATANDNAPGQVVISGHKAAVERAIALAKERGKKAMSLPVSAPFHCALMQPAADTMAAAFDAEIIQAPFLPVIANVTTAAVVAPDDIKKLLVAQITGMVRWRESVLAMIDMGVDTFVEIGTGKILSGMIKRINREVTVLNIETADDIDAFLKTL
jgi:[acyl-carrier-protein] S-malonyltransferase